MRSWRSVAVSALLLAACGTDVPPDDGAGSGSGSGSDEQMVDPNVCDSSYLDYENFGAPFVINWCRGCHSSAVPAGMRQKAPADANFDTLAEVQTWKDKIAARATGASPNMPPAGGPSEEERRLLAEWLACGAK